MKKILLTYAATAGAMLALDALWLGVVALPLYRQGIGHLMADQPQLAVAALFYLLYAAGLLVFGVLPQQGRPGLRRTAAMAALFGVIAYGTYDLTNLATLREWPLWLAVMDMAWGAAVSAAAAVAGKAALDRLS